MSSLNTSIPVPISRKRLLTIAGFGWMFDALDIGLLSFIMAALKHDWHLSPAELGWIGSINSIGMAVGAFTFGVLAVLAIIGLGQETRQTELVTQ